MFALDFPIFFQNLISWVFKSGIKIVLILLAAYLINKVFFNFFKRVIEKGVKDRISEFKKKKKIQTLMSVLGGTMKFTIWVVALLLILPEFKINIAPILASLGIAGLAIGMAAKDIISDFIAGIFILLEEQYSVGDRLKVSGIEGEVKEITLRRTIIQDENGFLHSIPNSQIKTVAKKEKGK